jgi:hypothetical protein
MHMFTMLCHNKQLVLHSNCATMLNLRTQFLSGILILNAHIYVLECITLDANTDLATFKNAIYGRNECL